MQGIGNKSVIVDTAVNFFYFLLQERCYKGDPHRVTCNIKYAQAISK